MMRKKHSTTKKAGNMFSQNLYAENIPSTLARCTSTTTAMHYKPVQYHTEHRYTVLSFPNTQNSHEVFFDLWHDVTT